MKFASVGLIDALYIVQEIFDTPDDRPIGDFFAQGDVDLGQLVWVDVDAINPPVQPNWIGTRNDGAWTFQPYVAPPIPDAVLANNARVLRDQLLRDNYDRGILMAQRYARMATTPEETSYAEGKIVELDNYAQALQEVPEQEGFPQTITWPIAPTK